MKIEVWTWGTGGPFGRELGVSLERRRRGHTATSILISEESDGGGATAHYMIDAGAPAVETMVEKGVYAPDILFLTHPHFDHISDLDRLANSRMRGLMLREGVRDIGEAKGLYGPLPVVGAEGCINHPADGMKARFGYLEGLVSWKPISDHDTWHSVQKLQYGATAVSPSEMNPSSPEDSGPKDKNAGKASRSEETDTPVGSAGSPLPEFKLLPVRHSKHAPGSSIFVFRFIGGVVGQCMPGEECEDAPTRNVVISGDFKWMEDWVADSPDLLDPACLVLDSNTIRASGKYHASFEENKSLINRWTTGDEEVLVLLNHISGFGDYMEGFYDGVPDDRDWQEAVDGYAPKPKVTVRIAEDGGCYRIR